MTPTYPSFFSILGKVWRRERFDIFLWVVNSLYTLREGRVRQWETVELVEARLTRPRTDCRLQLCHWTAVAPDQSSLHHSHSLPHLHQREILLYSSTDIISLNRIFLLSQICLINRAKLKETVGQWEEGREGVSATDLNILKKFYFPNRPRHTSLSVNSEPLDKLDF